jgi:alkylhydroperoxidase family enzyme
VTQLDPRVPLAADGTAPMAPAMARALDTFAAAAMRARTVDPVTTELVRLRCAWYHDCRVCGSLRLEEARVDGVDEEMAAKVALYEESDLPEAAKTALRLVDAVIIDPARADRRLVVALREHFTDEQIVELLFDVMKWSRQKELVALRLETPGWEGTNVLGFDANGDALIGAAALATPAA